MDPVIDFYQSWYRQGTNYVNVYIAVIASDFRFLTRWAQIQENDLVRSEIIAEEKEQLGTLSWWLWLNFSVADFFHYFFFLKKTPLDSCINFWWRTHSYSQIWHLCIARIRLSSEADPWIWNLVKRLEAWDWKCDPGGEKKLNMHWILLSQDNLIQLSFSEKCRVPDIRLCVRYKGQSHFSLQIRFANSPFCKHNNVIFLTDFDDHLLATRQTLSFTIWFLQKYKQWCV